VSGLVIGNILAALQTVLRPNAVGVLGEGQAPLHHIVL
jgi:hypothetical protein